MEQYLAQVNDARKQKTTKDAIEFILTGKTSSEADSYLTSSIINDPSHCNTHISRNTSLVSSISSTSGKYAIPTVSSITSFGIQREGLQTSVSSANSKNNINLMNTSLNKLTTDAFEVVSCVRHVSSTSLENDMQHANASTSFVSEITIDESLVDQCTRQLVNSISSNEIKREYAPFPP